MLFPVLMASRMICGLAGPWPAWRGPDWNGICGEKNVPLHWSANNNVRWCVSLPDRGNSTPVVWGDSVFITQGVDCEQRCMVRCMVMCYSAKTGRLRWQAGPTLSEKNPTHEDNPLCSSSPVTDGHRVIAWFGSAGVFAYDMNGRELWHRDLGKQSHQWGYASSPVLYGNLCLLNFGPGQRSFLIALDKRTEKTVWQYDLPQIGVGAKWQDFGGEAMNASMAVSDGAIYLHTHRRLWCIAE
ncbi:MAG: PQQ-binding-like beta-propeller repeat protein [Verrucomicrobia bacterium]|nr:PQQ-binding-like beta-propeller repeat protein [Verrucomicrobiota bacterium]